MTSECYTGHRETEVRAGRYRWLSWADVGTGAWESDEPRVVAPGEVRLIAGELCAAYIVRPRWRGWRGSTVVWFRVESLTRKPDWLTEGEATASGGWRRYGWQCQCGSRWSNGAAECRHCGGPRPASVSEETER